MLIQIPLLSFILFGVTYPLCFWLTAKNPIGHNFQRFHLACPVIIAGIGVMMVCTLPFTMPLKIASVLWVLAALIVTGIFWSKEEVHTLTITLLSLWGMALLVAVYQELHQPTPIQITALILSGLVTSSAFYAMNLGHFYLNVHGLPIKHLINATRAFALLLLARLILDLFSIATGQIMLHGEPVPFWQFLFSLEGMLAVVGIVFGTVLPLAGTYFAFGTLKLKNTQATTGILYVLLSALLLGHLACLFYLLKYGIAL